MTAAPAIAITMLTKRLRKADIGPPSRAGPSGPAALSTNEPAPEVSLGSAFAGNLEIYATSLERACLFRRQRDRAGDRSIRRFRNHEIGERHAAQSHRRTLMQTRGCRRRTQPLEAAVDRQ